MLSCYTRNLTHCNTLQHNAAHCNTLQHTVAHCDTLQHIATRVRILHTCSSDCHRTTHCNTLQHTVTHCTALQHSANTPVHRIVMKMPFCLRHETISTQACTCAKRLRNKTDNETCSLTITSCWLRCRSKETCIYKKRPMKETI